MPSFVRETLSMLHELQSRQIGAGDMVPEDQE